MLFCFRSLNFAISLSTIFRIRFSFVYIENKENNSLEGLSHFKDLIILKFLLYLNSNNYIYNFYTLIETITIYNNKKLLNKWFVTFEFDFKVILFCIQLLVIIFVL